MHIGKLFELNKIQLNIGLRFARTIFVILFNIKGDLLRFNKLFVGKKLIKIKFPYSEPTNPLTFV